MFGRNFRGRGQRGGMGLGFGGNSPPWPYIGMGRGGLPRCSYYFHDAGLLSYQPLVKAQVAGYKPFPASMNREEELSHLKDQAEAVKNRLDKIETRIQDLEAKE